MSEATGPQLMNRLLLRRVWRVYWDGMPYSGARAHTFFVHADSHHDAVSKARAAAEAIYGAGARSSLDFYNVEHFDDLIHEGLSTLEQLRPFESGWGSGKVICWCPNPVFLLRDPKWARLYYAMDLKDDGTEGDPLQSAVMSAAADYSNDGRRADKNTGYFPGEE